MMTSLILYMPLRVLRRQSTLIGRSVGPCPAQAPDPRVISLETIAPSGSGRLPITRGPPPPSAYSNKVLLLSEHDEILEQPQEFLLL